MIKGHVSLILIAETCNVNNQELCQDMERLEVNLRNCQFKAGFCCADLKIPNRRAALIGDMDLAH